MVTYRAARVLQFAGLTILPVAILLELDGALTLWKSLTLSGSGVLVFVIGYLLQGIAGEELK